MTRKTRELLKTLALIAFLAGGLLLVRMGALPLWVWFAMFVLLAVVRIVTRMDAYSDELVVGAEGVTRTHGSKMRKQLTEAVRWDELSRVEVRARETGPDRQDALFLLHGEGTNGVAVPGPLAQRLDLAATLRQRLPGFRDDLLAQALAAGESGAFVLWEKDAA